MSVNKNRLVNSVYNVAANMPEQEKFFLILAMRGMWRIKNEQNFY